MVSATIWLPLRGGLIIAFENSLQAGAFERQCGIHTTFYQGIELQDFIPMS